MFYSGFGIESSFNKQITRQPPKKASAQKGLAAGKLFITKYSLSKV